MTITTISALASGELDPLDLSKVRCDNSMQSCAILQSRLPLTWNSLEYPTRLNRIRLGRLAVVQILGLRVLRWLEQPLDGSLEGTVCGSGPPHDFNAVPCPQLLFYLSFGRCIAWTRSMLLPLDGGSWKCFQHASKFRGCLGPASFWHRLGLRAVIGRVGGSPDSLDRALIMLCFFTCFFSLCPSLTALKYSST